MRRTPVVAPANLTVQWQCEMKDKFREKFEVTRGDVLRTAYGQNPWQDYDQTVTWNFLGGDCGGCQGEPAALTLVLAEIPGGGGPST